MKNIIIPESEVEKYTRIINKSQMIQPILVSGFYTLPLDIWGIEKIDRIAGLKDFPIQDIELVATEIKK